MKRKLSVFLSVIVLLMLVVVFVPQKVNAESSYKYINFGDSEYGLWDDTQHAYKPTERVKYGKKYYWAVLVEDNNSNGSGYAIYKVDYYCANSKTAAGTKLFSSYEISGGGNELFGFYTNGTYIIKAETSLENPNISVNKYNMKGKKKKTLQVFKAGSSSSYGEGYNSHCNVRILKIYGGKLYASYQQSSVDGSMVRIVYFPVKSKKTFKTLTKTSNYFCPATGKYLGVANEGGSNIYNLETGKSHQISSSVARYLGKRKSKEYFYTEFYTDNNSTVTIFSVNKAWKKRTKVCKLKNASYPFMKGKYVYYSSYNSDYNKEYYYQYDIVKKVKKKITKEKYYDIMHAYDDNKTFKDRDIL
ncbi:MAG: hypothetical protein IJJ06_12250 [Mogibacterium sp.]|nr:hypothetical protein [Mogibacterium sp.]MBR0341762.1 hypothetical protein [Oscillospiraceae bacterium]